MNDDAQILIARLLTHQTLRRDDKMVKRALSDDQFRAEVDKRLLECGLKLLDNVYADHVTLALHRNVEPKIFGAKDIWQNNNFGLTRDGVALLVVLWAQIILPKRQRQETHQAIAVDQSDMFDKDNPIPRAEDTSIGISYTTLLADFVFERLHRAMGWNVRRDDEHVLQIEGVARGDGRGQVPAMDRVESTAEQADASHSVSRCEARGARGVRPRPVSSTLLRAAAAAPLP